VPVALSANGKTVLFDESGEATRGILYLRQTDGSPAVRLADTPFRDTDGPSLSPDGKWMVALKSDAPRTLELFPTGPGEPRSFPLGGIEATAGFDGMAARWFADGKRIVFHGSERGRGERAYVLHFDSGRIQPVTPELAEVRQWLLMPDDQNLLLVATDTTMSIYPLVGGEPRQLPGKMDPSSAIIGLAIDGHSCFVSPSWSWGTERTGRIDRYDLMTGRQTLWKHLRPADPTGVTTVQMGPITPDGRSYAYSFMRVLSDLYLVEGLR
jgi:WD40-like Beta Propeller Repeat